MFYSWMAFPLIPKMYSFGQALRVRTPSLLRNHQKMSSIWVLPLMQFVKCIKYIMYLPADLLIPILFLFFLLECHPTCRQCHGPSESDCISCHPHVTVTGGNCRTSCKEEQFLNLMGYCAGEWYFLMVSELLARGRQFFILGFWRTWLLKSLFLQETFVSCMGTHHTASYQTFDKYGWIQRESSINTLAVSKKTLRTSCWWTWSFDSSSFYACVTLQLSKCLFKTVSLKTISLSLTLFPASCCGEHLPSAPGTKI